jgi:hypothetical protein
MRLRILVVDVTRARIQEILPWVQGKWVVIWATNDVLLVCGMSNTAGTYEISAHECRALVPVLNRVPTDAEARLVIEAFHEKYGTDPSPARKASGG